MKKYNVKNYIRYKLDLEKAIKKLDTTKQWHELSRSDLITSFMPLVENIGRKFATSQQASGVMSILDILQEGNAGLTKAVDKVNWEVIYDSDDPEKTIKSFFI